MNKDEASKESKEGTNTDPKFTKSEMYREVLYVIAWITLGQGLCFLGAAMIQNDVSILPDDPFTLIGSLYIAMGLGFILISRLCGRKSSESDSKTSCKNSQLETMARDSTEINQLVVNREARKFKELHTKDNQEMGVQKSPDIEDSSRKLENVEDVTEVNSGMWVTDLVM